jgi:hypothetical protein
MEITDYFGRTIRLTEERLEHLLNNHPEIKAESISIIVETIQNPEQIIVSDSDNSVELFYRYYLKTTIGDKWLCVVVKNLETDFFIITAYFTNQVKKGEILWKKT